MHRRKVKAGGIDILTLMEIGLCDYVLLVEFFKDVSIKFCFQTLKSELKFSRYDFFVTLLKTISTLKYRLICTV